MKTGYSTPSGENVVIKIEVFQKGQGFFDIIP